MPELEKEQVLVQTSDKPDRVSKTKTVYDVSAWEIFWRNFLAGIARTFGGIIIYLLFISVIGAIFLQFISPILFPALKQLNSLYGGLERIPGMPKNPIVTPP